MIGVLSPKKSRNPLKKTQIFDLIPGDKTLLQHCTQPILISVQ